MRNSNSPNGFDSDDCCSEEAGFGSSDAAAAVSAGGACDAEADSSSPCVGLDECSVSSSRAPWAATRERLQYQGSVPSTPLLQPQGVGSVSSGLPSLSGVGLVPGVACPIYASPSPHTPHACLYPNPQVPLSTVHSRHTILRRMAVLPTSTRGSLLLVPLSDAAWVHLEVGGLQGGQVGSICHWGPQDMQKQTAGKKSTCFLSFVPQAPFESSVPNPSTQSSGKRTNRTASIQAAMSRTSVSAVIFRTIGFVESCQFEPFLKASGESLTSHRALISHSVVFTRKWSV